MNMTQLVISAHPNEEPCDIEQNAGERPWCNDCLAADISREIRPRML
jgi:hypothetical protein